MYELYIKPSRMINLLSNSRPNSLCYAFSGHKIFFKSTYFTILKDLLEMILVPIPLALELVSKT
jgi:hypothetical protein